MDEVEEFLEDFLAHYASQYYDPAKAHEYYLKTRELKGTRSVGSLKKKSQKEAWTYANKQIQEKQKGDLKSASAARTAAVAQLRAKATAKRQEIAAKLKGAIKDLSSDRKASSSDLTSNQKMTSQQITAFQKSEAKRISDDASRKIAALAKMPDGLNKEQRREFADKRAAEIAQIRGDATNERKSLANKVKEQRASLSEATKSQRQALSGDSRQSSASERESIRAQRNKMSADLKASVAKARSDYLKSRDNLKKKYDQVAQKEFDAIRTKV